MSEQLVITTEGIISIIQIQPTVETITVRDDAPDHGHLVGLTDDDHTQYALVVLSATEPVNPRVGTIWVPTE